MARDECRCGHPREAHTHYRPGTDCSLCGAGTCARFRASGAVATALRAVAARLPFRRRGTTG